MNAGSTGMNGATNQQAAQAAAHQLWEAPPTTGPSLSGPAVHVDCEGCTVRPQACGDCVVTFLLGSPPEGVDLAPDEQEALDVLAASGLVPALQYRPSAAEGPDPR
jgi:hypothetical protein